MTETTRNSRQTLATFNQYDTEDFILSDRLEQQGEDILRYFGQKYYDTVIRRVIAIGQHEAGELIGLEIIGASSFIRDVILESAQQKILNLTIASN